MRASLAPSALRRATLPLRRAPRAAAQPKAIRRCFASVVEGISKDPAELDEVTTLDNGIRVATEALPGHFSGIGVYVDAGSRYENQSLQGVSHIIDRLAFKSTESRSADEMLECIETLGGHVQCASSREAILYQCATFNAAVPAAVALLADTIRRPRTTPAEVAQQLATAEYEIGEIWAKPELILPEISHMAAFAGNTLGNPLLCPRERLPHIDARVVDAYRRLFYRPERIVVAFAGVAHAEAVALVERHFGDMRAQPLADAAALAAGGARTGPSLSSSSPSSSSSSPPPPHSLGASSSSSSSTASRLMSKMPFLKNLSTSAAQQASVVETPSSIDSSSSSSSPLVLPSEADLRAPARYTGGFRALDPLPPPTNPALPRLSHIHISFEGLPITADADLYALAALQTLLGGGGSFSAGGPGKGMYSRLYTHVLNRHAWVESCVCGSQSYTDAGLFGVAASCAPERVADMLELVCRELHALTLRRGAARLQPGEVARAKNALRSALLMNLESRMVGLEDLGRQVQVRGRKVGVREMCRAIDALTVEDLRRVAAMVLGGRVESAGGGTGRPTVVLQECAEQAAQRPLTWPEIQERMSRWKLGRM